MRTTVEIPDSLLKEAKLAAVEQGTTLKVLITQGLEVVLRAGKGEGYRLAGPPVVLGADSPLRRLSPDDVAGIDAEEEFKEVDEVYRGP